MSGKIAPDARSHRVSRTKTGSFSIELHPVGSVMVRASSLVGEFQQPANDPISAGTWIVLGIAGFLFVFATAVAVIGYRDRQLPIELRDKDLDRKLARIGLPIKLLGAATVVMVGIMNIMGWKL